jgi:hypothetical protein
MRGLVEFIKDELSIKSNIKDVCVLVDMKANTSDIKQSIEEMQRNL